MPTLFEKIIAGELPATIVFRDSRVIAFLDIRPAAPVHILIVPHKVIPTTDDIADEDESLIGHMVIVARDIARQHGIAKSGYRLIINCNPDSGQEVYHLHMHLLGGRPLGPLVQRRVNSKTEEQAMKKKKRRAEPESDAHQKARAAKLKPRAAGSAAKMVSAHRPWLARLRENAGACFGAPRTVSGDRTVPPRLPARFGRP